MADTNGLNLLNVDLGFPLLQSSIMATILPTQIRYYKLSLGLDGEGIYFSFIDNSGIYYGYLIDDFITAVRTGALPATPSLPVAASICPDILINKSCYIVIELGGNYNWQFQPRLPGVIPPQAHPEKYFDLFHVDTGGTRWANAAPATPPCKLLFFSVGTPSPAPATGDPVIADEFNVYVQLTRKNGNVLRLIVDPDIKNRGGDGDNQG